MSAMGRRGEGPRRAKEGRGMQMPLFSKIKEGQLLRPTPRRRLSPTCPLSPLASCNDARTRRTMRSWLFWCCRLLVQRLHVLIPFSFLVNATWKLCGTLLLGRPVRELSLSDMDLRTSPSPVSVSEALGPPQEGQILRPDSFFLGDTKSRDHTASHSTNLHRVSRYVSECAMWKIGRAHV